MDNQNYIYYLPFVAILVIFVFFLKRLRLYGKAQAAKANKTEQYERRTAYLYAIVFILLGLLWQGTTLINWSSIPPGNEPTAAMGIIIGFAFMLFGIYKLYRYHSKR
ncbi:MAG TPA: hypothetical protein VJ810_25660 [Blastocatellia bacterium]|nr:hypothetical protein [Blastocatellia bacterium]